MIIDKATSMIVEEIQMAVIFIDFHAAVNCIQHTRISPGPTLPSAIIPNTEDIHKQNIQLKYCWVL
jgi:hypothetical protein